MYQSMTPDVDRAIISQGLTEKSIAAISADKSERCEKYLYMGDFLAFQHIMLFRLQG